MTQTRAKPKRKYTRRSTADKIATALDRQLLKILKHGRAAFDCNGQPIFDADGAQAFRPPTAADLNAARQRLAELRRAGEGAPPSPVVDALERLRAKRLDGAIDTAEAEREAG